VSTNFLPDEWISQAEAARIRGVTRQAIAKLVKAKRIRTMSLGGHTLIHRGDLSRYQPAKAGRPRRRDE
jgi:excisionase family DNA binding protein